MRLQKISKHEHLWFGCLLGFLLLLILIRYAFQVDVPRVVLLVVIALIATIGDRSEIIAASISLIPMHESIDFYYALVICMAIYLIKYFKDLRIGFNILLVFLVCIWEALHCLQIAFSIVDFLSYVIPFIILAILMSIDAEKLDYNFIVRVFALSTFGITLMLFIRVLFFANFDIAAALVGLQRLGSDSYSNIQDVVISGGQINSNSLGVITVVASAGLMQLRRVKSSSVGDMILMGVMLLFTALTASRTYLICLVLMFFLFIITEEGGVEKKLKLIGLIGILLTVVVVAMAIFFPNTFTYFVNRFFVDDITTGRDDLMVEYHRFIVSDPKNLFFGIGLQDYGNRLTQIYRASDNVPHNSLQEIIVAWGIPGLLIFGLLFFNMFQASSRCNRKYTLINWIPLIIILFKSMAGQLLTSSYTMLALSFAYLSLCQDFSSVKDIEDGL